MGICRLVQSLAEQSHNHQYGQPTTNGPNNGHNNYSNYNNAYCNTCNAPYNNGSCNNGCYNNGYYYYNNGYAPQPQAGNTYIVGGHPSYCGQRKAERRALRDIRRIERGGYCGSGYQVVNGFTPQPIMQGPPMQGQPMQGQPMQGPPIVSQQSQPSFRDEPDRFARGIQGDAIPKAPASSNQGGWWSPDDAPPPAYRNTVEKGQ